MIIHIFPDNDATLYEVSSSMNTGMDPSLELEKVVTKDATPNKFNSRIVQKNMGFHMNMRFMHTHFHNLFQMELVENYKILKVMVE